jgi:uncharacterized lipoprotein
MFNITQTLSLCLLVSLLSGCGMIVRQMDSSWNDHRTVYNRSDSLPPLGVPAELATAKDNTTKQATEISKK